jgi:hypothetical protein
MLLGCGSGGGSGSDTSSSMGTAAVFIKDAPTEEYDSIVLCINKATLEPGSVTLFESDTCVEVDLLDHQEKPFLLTVKDIPARTYNQIRLGVDYVDTMGGSCDRLDLDIKIPSGIIKVNFQGPVSVKSGDKLGFEIDIHAKRSLNLHVAGNSQKCIFRPVIIATVTNLGDIPPENKCPRILNGTIIEIKEVEGEVREFKLRFSHDAKSQIFVRVNADTTIFDENGSFTTSDALEVGQKVKVRGEILKDGSIRAFVVAIGDLIKLYGTALTKVISENWDLKFEMKLAPGQVVIDDTIYVVVDNQTLILIDCNTEVGMDAIKPGIGVRAIGKISEGDLIAAVLFLEEQKTYGTIIAMLDKGSFYELEFIPAGESESIIIILPDESGVALEGDGSIEKELLEELVNCEPRKAHITLNESDPRVADFVEVKDEVIEGIINTTDSFSRTITLQGEPGTHIQVQDFATILRNGKLIHFKQLQYGDEIRVFGLAACPEDDIDFYGFVIVVLNFEEKGDEGCSQGYWKNHRNSWGPTRYETTDRYNVVFGVPYYKTLLGALESGGGGEYALGRQAVAALLNATHPDMDYYYTEAEVIDIVQDAYDTDDFERAKNLLEEHISPCPLD